MRFLHLFKFGLVEGLAMSPEVGDSWETLAYFLFMCKPFSFQPAYAASLCSLVGKGLYEPITTLASGCSCKPDSHSPTSSNYFVVTFALHARSLCPAPAVVRKSWQRKSFPFSAFRFPLVSLLRSLVEDNRCYF